MDKRLKEALNITGLVTLAKAYETAEELLSDRDISDPESVDLTGWSGEEACYLEIILSTDRLLPFLTTPSDSGESATLGIITTFEISRLNNSATRFMNKLAGESVEGFPERFDPEFELSNLVRNVAMIRS